MNLLLAVLRMITFGLFGRLLTSRRLSKKIKIVLLGYPETGKTVYSASMFHQLSLGTGRPDGLCLSAPFETRRELLGVYNQLADPAQSFLPPTNPGDKSRWQFTCQFAPEAGDRAKKPYDVVVFDCLDYSGESTADLFATELTKVTRDFAKEIDQIDIVFGVLDGSQVYQFMQGAPPPRFLQDIRILLHLMAPYPYIHFILTKWDVFAPEYRLDEVVKKLMAIPDFRLLARTRARTGALRLLPVSSLGPGFARPGDGGRMEKVPGMTPVAINLELPIACAYTDLMRRRVRRIATVKYATSRSSAFILVRPLLWILRMVTLTVNVTTFGLSFQFILQSASGTSDGRAPLQTKGGNPSVRNRRNAIEYAYGQFTAMINHLDRDYPQNNLATYGES